MHVPLVECVLGQNCPNATSLISLAMLAMLFWFLRGMYVLQYECLASSVSSVAAGAYVLLGHKAALAAEGPVWFRRGCCREAGGGVDALPRGPLPRE